jgi:hypothetical protein
VCACIRLYLCVHAYVCASLSTYIRMYAQIWYMYLSVFVRTCLCMYRCRRNMHVYMYICLCVMYVCIWRCMYTSNHHLYTRTFVVQFNRPLQQLVCTAATARGRTPSHIHLHTHMFTIPLHKRSLVQVNRPLHQLTYTSTYTCSRSFYTHAVSYKSIDRCSSSQPRYSSKPLAPFPYISREIRANSY